MLRIRNSSAPASVRPFRRLGATLLTTLLLGVHFHYNYFLAPPPSPSSDRSSHNGMPIRNPIDDVIYIGGDPNGNRDNEGRYLEWLLAERNRSAPLPLSVHHRGQSGLGHQLLRLSCVYHLAVLYSIPRVWLASNPMCGGNIYTIHNSLLGPHDITSLKTSSLLVDVPHAYAGGATNLIKNHPKLPEGFPNLTFVNNTDLRLEGGNSFQRYLSIDNDVHGYERGRNVHTGPSLEDMIRNEFWSKDLSDYQMYHQMMLLFRHQHADKIQSLVENIAFRNHTVFGLHIRTGNGEGGDFNAKGRGMPHLDEWIIHVVLLLCDYEAAHAHYFLDKPLMLYVGTDSASVVPRLQSASKMSCEIPVASAAQAYPEDGEGVSFNTFARKGQEDCLDGWRDMFLDMYIFTQCNTVVAGTYSSFTQAAPLSFVMHKAKLHNRQRATAASSVHPHYFCEMGTNGRRMECFDTLASWLRRNDAAVDWGNRTSPRHRIRHEVFFPEKERGWAIYPQYFKGTALREQA